jgi:hypothetical protein
VVVTKVVTQGIAQRLLLKELVTRVAQGIGDMIAQRLLLKELLKEVVVTKVVTQGIAQRSGGDKGCYSRNW